MKIGGDARLELCPLHDYDRQVSRAILYGMKILRKEYVIPLVIIIFFLLVLIGFFKLFKSESISVQEPQGSRTLTLTYPARYKAATDDNQSIIFLSQKCYTPFCSKNSFLEARFYTLGGSVMGPSSYESFKNENDGGEVRPIISEKDIIYGSTTFHMIENRSDQGYGDIKLLKIFDRSAILIEISIYQGDPYIRRGQIEKILNSIEIVTVSDSSSISNNDGTIAAKSCGAGASAGSGLICPTGYVCKIERKGPPAEGTCVKSWKTYTDYKWGFELLYPENFSPALVTEILPSYANPTDGVKFVASDGLPKAGITFFMINDSVENLVSGLEASLKRSITFGGRTGVQYFIGAEGDGLVNFYTSLAPNQTLVVSNHFISNQPDMNLVESITSTFQYKPGRGY